MAKNAKSDIAAKKAFAAELGKRGFSDIRITRTPCDIRAVRRGRIHRFEIKYTNQRERYFGAATLTEWEAALDSPNFFWFVIATHLGGEWKFDEYTPAQFMALSYIPPFKIFFNVPVKRNPNGIPRTKTAITLTRARLEQMSVLYARFRKS